MRKPINSCTLLKHSHCAKKNKQTHPSDIKKKEKKIESIYTN